MHTNLWCGWSGPSSSDADLAKAGDAASYLPDCINFTARMLESLFADASTSRQFVDQGGIEALLAIYTLPKLPPTFGSSPPAQALMAAMRCFTAAHADAVSVHLNRALLAQLQLAIARAKVCTACCTRTAGHWLCPDRCPCAAQEKCCLENQACATALGMHCDVLCALQCYGPHLKVQLQLICLELYACRSLLVLVVNPCMVHN